MSERATEIEMAQSLLREMGRESLLAYFTRRLRLGKHLESRPLLLVALAQLAGSDSKQLLITIVNDLTESQETRVAAAKSLGQLLKQTAETSERSELTPILVRLLEDDNIEVRSAVATQLSDLQVKEAVESLQKLLEEDKLDVLAGEQVQKFLATVITPSVNLPPINKDLFIGRRGELEALHHAFSESQIVILAGIGGVGKTSLASMFARESNYDVKVWHSCRYSVDPTDLVNRLKLQLEQLHPGETSHTEFSDRPNFYRLKIQNEIIELLNNRSALIVLDDYDEGTDESEIITFIEHLAARLSNANFLIVGRFIPRKLEGAVIHLEGLSFVDSLELLRAAADHRNIYLDPNDAQKIARLADGNSLILNFYIRALFRSLSVDEVDTDGVISSIISQSIERLSQSERRALEVLAHFDEPIFPDDPRINILFKQEGIDKLSECVATLSRVSLISTDSQNSIALHTFVRQLINSRTDKRTRLRVNQSLGTYYEKRGKLLRAATHFARADIPGQAILILHEHSMDIINQGDILGALKLLNSFSTPNELETGVTVKLLDSIGFFSQFHGEHERAKESYQHVLKIVRDGGDRKEECRVLGRLGRMYADMGETQQAVQYYERRLAIAHEIADYREKGSALRNLGQAYANMGETQQAIQYYEQHVAIARGIGDRTGEINALGDLGRAYADMGETQQAIHYYAQHLAMARALGDRKREGVALGTLGRAYADIGETHQAITHYEQRLAIAREIGDRMGESDALGGLGRIYAGIGETQQAIENHTEHLAIAREIGDCRGEAVALSNLAHTYVVSGDQNQAIEFYEQALEIMHRIADRRGEGNLLSNLGAAYADLGDHDQAIEFHEQALEIMHKIADRRGEGNVLSNLGVAYAAMGNQKQAIEFHEQALVIMNKIRDRRGEGNELSSIGAAYEDLGDQHRAIEFYDQALEIMRKIGDPKGESKALGRLGISYSALGETKRAMEFLQEQLTIIRKIGDRRDEGKALCNLSLIVDRLNDRTSAVAYAKDAPTIFEQIKDPQAITLREILAEWHV